MKALSVITSAVCFAGMLAPTVKETPAAAAPIVRETTPQPPKPKPKPSRSRVFSVADLPTPWKKLAWCESRWHLHSVSRSGQHFGLFQIHKGWFRPFKINPRTANAYQQWLVAKHVYATQGRNAWDCARQAGLK